MRNIQYILECWGGWSRQRFETDYSPIAAGFKGLLPQETGSQSCSDHDAMIVDSCVSRLKHKRPDEHQLIEAYYIKGISKRQLAKEHKKDEKIIRIKLQLAEGFVEGCLSMLEVRLEMDS